MRRILFLSNIGELGGAELALLDLVAALDRKRFEPWAFVPERGELAQRLRDVGARVETCSTMSRLYRSKRPWRVAKACSAMFRSSRALRRLVKAQLIDIVHANTTAAAAHALLLPGALRAPVIWQVRDLKLGIEGAWIARNCAGIIAVSRACANTLPKAAATRPVVIIPSGIALGGVHRRASSTSRAPLLVAVSHFVPWKGHALLIDALRIVRARGVKALLLVAGGDLWGDNDKLREQLLAHIKAAGLGNAVTLLGAVPDVRELLCRADCLVHPAFPEPFGRAIVEALSCDCPVIAFAGEHGPAEILSDGVGGMLVSPRTADALADAIVQIVMEPGLRDRLARGARSKVKDMYESHTVTRRVEAFYQRILENGSSARA